jgi:hypothetical protein
MQKSQFKQAYRAARIGQINSDTLESIAAIIAVQDARKPDLIGKVYRDSKEFMDFLEARHEKAERLAELKSRRRARKSDYQVESVFVDVEQEVYRDEMVDCFNQVFDDR